VCKIWTFDAQPNHIRHFPKFTSNFFNYYKNFDPLKRRFIYKDIPFQDASALDYALLTNKINVAKYLSMLYFLYGKDVNEKNSKGHTILHLAARRGDLCSQTLEELLKVFYQKSRHFLNYYNKVLNFCSTPDQGI
jgi:hypothetical protein